jgi:hypothetical protein
MEMCHRERRRARRAEAAPGAGAVSRKSRARLTRASLHVPAGHLGHQVAIRAGGRAKRADARVAVFFFIFSFSSVTKFLETQIVSSVESVCILESWNFSI